MNQSQAEILKELGTVQVDWKQTKDIVDQLRHQYNHNRSRQKFTLSTRSIATVVLSLANQTLLSMKERNLYRLDKIAKDKAEPIRIETYYHQIVVMLFNKNVREEWAECDIKNQHQTIRRHLNIMKAAGIISGFENISVQNGANVAHGRKIVITIPQSVLQIEKKRPLITNNLSSLSNKNNHYSSIIINKDNRRKEKGESHSDTFLQSENTAKKDEIQKESIKNDEKISSILREIKYQNPPTPQIGGSIADQICHGAIASKSTIVSIDQPSDAKKYMKGKIELKFNTQIHDDRNNRINILYHMMMELIFPHRERMSVESIAKAQYNMHLMLDYVLEKYDIKEDAAYQLLKNAIGYVAEQIAKGKFEAWLHPITYLSTERVGENFKINKGCLRNVVDKYFEKLKRYDNAKKFNERFKRMQSIKEQVAKKSTNIFEKWQNQQFSIRQAKMYITGMEKSINEQYQLGTITEAFRDELLAIILTKFAQVL